VRSSVSTRKSPRGRTSSRRSAAGSGWPQSASPSSSSHARLPHAPPPSAADLRRTDRGRTGSVCRMIEQPPPRPNAAGAALTRPDSLRNAVWLMYLGAVLQVAFGVAFFMIVGGLGDDDAVRAE